MNRWYILMFVLAVGFTACDDDDDFIFDPDLMHFDGSNDNAPILPPGQVETAVKFDNNVLKNYSGKKIDAVQLFIYELPAKAELVMYSGGDNQPGVELYFQDITSDLEVQSWNEIPLTSNFDLPADGLWIGLRLNITQPVQVMGCDAGPRVEGGDWMYESGDSQWLTFSTRTGGIESINWNVRASMVD